MPNPWCILAQALGVSFPLFVTGAGGRSTRAHNLPYRIGRLRNFWVNLMRNEMRIYFFARRFFIGSPYRQGLQTHPIAVPKDFSQSQVTRLDTGRARYRAFAPPCQRLLVQHVQISLFCDDLIAKLHCLGRLRLAKVLIRRACDVVIPHTAANCVKHDPRKTVIVSNRPVAFAGLRECGHDPARQMQILLDKGEGGRLR
jgi:hypothetical protein